MEATRMLTQRSKETSSFRSLNGSEFNVQGSMFNDRSLEH
jgi:hypothetical protein